MNYHKCATYGCPNMADEFEYYCECCKKKTVSTTAKQDYSKFTKNGPITITPWKSAEGNPMDARDVGHCLKTGMVIRARTNAEFLNKMFGTNYKQWYKTTYKTNGVWVWMVEFNHVHHCYVDNTYRFEWENRIVSEKKIFEYYHGNSFIRDGKVIGELEPHLRLVVEKKGYGDERVYIIHGLFAPDYDECEFPRKRIYKKVGDVLELKK